ncbi:DUF3667 domain-containing protein [Spirosoma spitsbergense]|uniref:DUF3667 domain-containing protein n=1 Tax=Spirosoma spitsbergense TaxID=431554 RepID=UPI00036B51A0|nr:DUF3667 domain-containing protein [Spirosoma spitsbergense]
MKPQTNVKCLNCNRRYKGTFCPECGQKASTHRYSLRELKEHLIDKHKLYENKEVFTLKEILFRPGTVVSDYLAGRRVRYGSPFALVAVAVGCMFWVSRRLDYGLMSSTPMEVRNLSSTATADDKLWAQTLDSFGPFYETTSDYTSLFGILFTSLISYRIFRKQKLLFGEHCVINAVSTIGATLIAVVFVPLLKITDDANYLILFYLITTVGLYYYVFFDFFRRYYTSKAGLIWRLALCAVLGLAFDFVFILFLFLLSVLFLDAENHPYETLIVTDYLYDTTELFEQFYGC